MTNPASAFQPAIDALEQDYADLERQGNALLTSINLLRAKAGLPPRPGGWATGSTEARTSSNGAAPVKLHSDTFTGKRLGAAVREYLEMRKKAGIDAPATVREIFDALKEGGFVSKAKDDATGLVVLRTMLRKNSAAFAKLQNGKYGLRSWYPNLRPPKETGGDATDEGDLVEDAGDEGTETAAESDEDKAAVA